MKKINFLFIVGLVFGSLIFSDAFAASVTEGIKDARIHNKHKKTIHKMGKDSIVLGTAQRHEAFINGRVDLNNKQDALKGKQIAQDWRSRVNGAAITDLSNKNAGRAQDTKRDITRLRGAFTKATARLEREIKAIEAKRTNLRGATQDSGSTSDATNAVDTVAFQSGEEGSFN